MSSLFSPLFLFAHNIVPYPRTSSIAKHDVSTFDDVVTLWLDRESLLIYRKPADASVAVGDAVSFSVDMRSDALPYACQWQVRKTLMNKGRKPYARQGWAIDVRRLRRSAKQEGKPAATYILHNPQSAVAISFEDMNGIDIQENVRFEKKTGEQELKLE